MPPLWRVVEHVGGAARKRFMQHALGITRTLGLKGHVLEDSPGTGSGGLHDDMLTSLAEVSCISLETRLNKSRCVSWNGVVFRFDHGEDTATPRRYAPQRASGEPV